jgi:hypothetical protein
MNFQFVYSINYFFTSNLTNYILFTYFLSILNSLVSTDLINLSFLI